VLFFALLKNESPKYLDLDLVSSRERAGVELRTTWERWLATIDKR
jgi:hypothetical protein